MLPTGGETRSRSAIEVMGYCFMFSLSPDTQTQGRAENSALNSASAA